MLSYFFQQQFQASAKKLSATEDLFLQLANDPTISILYERILLYRFKMLIFDIQGEWLLLQKLYQQMKTLLAECAIHLRTDLQLEQARCISLMAVTEARKSNFWRARESLQKAFSLYQNAQFLERPHLHGEVGTLLSDWGACLLNDGQKENAVEKFIESEKLLAPLQEDFPQTKTILGGMYGNWSAALRHLQQPEDALKINDRTFSILENSPEETILDKGMLLANAHTVRGNILCDLHEWALAEVAFSRAEKLFQARSLDDRHAVESNRLKLLVSAGRLIGNGRDLEWAAVCSQQLSLALDIVDPNGFDSPVKQYLFLLFHYRWMKYCAKHDPDWIPWVLAAVQGRSYNQDYHDEIDESGLQASVLDDEDTIMFREMRRILKESRETFYHYGDESKKSLMKYLENSITKKPYSSEQEQMRKFDEKITLQYEGYWEQVRQFRALQEKLIHKKGLKHWINPFHPITKEDLQGRLGVDEALVCCIDLDLPSTDHEEGIAEQGVWVLTARGDSQYCSLELNLDSCIHLRHILESQYQGKGRLRRGRTYKKLHDSHLGIKELQDYLAEKFWDPLRNVLPQNLRRLTFVSYGRFHLFPFDLGNPFSCHWIHVPGLVFVEKERAPSPQELSKTYATIFNNNEVVFPWFCRHLVKPR